MDASAAVRAAYAAMRQTDAKPGVALHSNDVRFALQPQLGAALREAAP